jgi:uncharacterized protein (DUF433 family)
MQLCTSTCQRPPFDGGRSTWQRRHLLCIGFPPISPRAASLPFIALAEAHILRALREAGLSLREIREATARLRTELGTEYALASAKLARAGRDLLVDLASEAGHPRWERARDGQLLVEHVLDDYLEQVVWVEGDEYPVRLRLRAYHNAQVIVDPRFSFGQPIFARSKVRVEDVIAVFRAGERIADIAGEYGLEPEEVEAAVRVAARRAA